MQFLSVFPNKTKIDDFYLRNADVSRPQGLCHVIYIFLELLYARFKCAKSNHCGICVTDFRKRRGGLLGTSPSVCEQPLKAPS